MAGCDVKSRVSIKGVLFALVALFCLARSDAGMAQQWVEFDSPANGFSALFPKTPQEVPANNGVQQTTFLADLGTSAYLISVVVIPQASVPANPDDAYWTRLVQAYASGSGSKITSQHAATLVGHGGVEAITVDSSGNLYWLLDMVLVDNRLYQIVSGGPKGHDTSNDAYRFRDSFRLTQ